MGSILGWSTCKKATNQRSMFLFHVNVCPSVYLSLSLPLLLPPSLKAMEKCPWVKTFKKMNERPMRAGTLLFSHLYPQLSEDGIE